MSRNELSLAERIQAEIAKRSGVEPEGSEWRPIRDWATEWNKSPSQAERYVRVAVEAGLMEAKRGRVMASTGARVSTLYRDATKAPPKRK